MRRRAREQQLERRNPDSRPGRGFALCRLLGEAGPHPRHDRHPIPHPRPCSCPTSGGQRQRISIARALLRATQVLVLDEPTTGLDTEAKAALLGPLSRLVRCRTTIVISHDPEIVAWADRVVTIDDGRVVEVAGDIAVAA